MGKCGVGCGMGGVQGERVIMGSGRAGVLEGQGARKELEWKEMRELGSRVRSQGFKDRGQIGYDVT